MDRLKLKSGGIESKYLDHDFIYTCTSYIVYSADLYCANIQPGVINCP